MGLAIRAYVNQFRFGRPSLLNCVECSSKFGAHCIAWGLRAGTIWICAWLLLMWYGVGVLPTVVDEKCLIDFALVRDPVIAEVRERLESRAQLLNLVVH